MFVVNTTFNYIKMSEDNITDIMSKLKDIDSNTNNKTMMILQCITILFILGKPVLMYWIRAKYNVKEEPETIENQHEDDNFKNN